MNRSVGLRAPMVSSCALTMAACRGTGSPKVGATISPTFSFIDNSRGWAVGERGKILFTNYRR